PPFDLVSVNHFNRGSLPTSTTYRDIITEKRALVIEHAKLEGCWANNEIKEDLEKKLHEVGNKIEKMKDPLKK
ncbi:MAG: hypothetical protein Q8J64_06315, partial [Thermodesulfovibrionales bacterium]|nr:hypothetical protein [Thermodesulfovibrionales bacterium]